MCELTSQLVGKTWKNKIFMESQLKAPRQPEPPPGPKICYHYPGAQGHLWDTRGFGCGKGMKRCGWLNTIEPSQKWMMAIIHTIRSEFFFVFPPNFWATSHAKAISRYIGFAMELWWNLACDSLPFHPWIQCSFSRFLHSSRLNKPICN